MTPSFAASDAGLAVTIPGLYDPPPRWRWWLKLGMNPTRRTYWHGTSAVRRVAAVSPTQITVR